MKRIYYLMLIVLIILLSSGCSHNTEKPGFYLFDKDTYKTYINLTIENDDINTFSITSKPRNYTVRNDITFTNCVIEIMVSFMSESRKIDFKLTKDGSNKLSISDNTLFTDNFSYEIKNIYGYVEVPLQDESIIEYDNVKYEIEFRNKELSCTRITKYDFGIKYIFFNKQLKTIYGQIPVNIDFDYSSTGNFLCYTGDVEVLVFMGEYDTEAFEKHDFFGKINNNFPNLKVIAIEKCNGDFIKTIENLPESGVDVYINCSDELRESIKYFVNVNSVYTFEEFDLNNYKE